MINNQYLKTESLDDEANDLEDYLQEVFDKYGIVKTKMSDTPTQASYYINSKNQIDIDNILDYNGKVDYRMTSVIYNEIMRIKPTIEKRLGTEIEVEMETEFKSIDSGGYINITNTGKKIDKYNEGKTRYNMEDLEDYLQEFFDRFNILKIKNTQDLWDAGDRLCYIADKYSIVIENIPIPEMFGNVGEKGRRDPKEIMDELVKELNEIIPNIEKRFGFYIKIKPNIYGGWISIEPDKIIVLKN